MSYLRTLAATAAVLTLGTLGAARANAACGVTPQASKTGAGVFSLKPRNPMFASPARADRTVATTPKAAALSSIVGFWYTQIRAGGELVDDGFDVWQSDGLEILNDSPVPATGAVCLGVYAQTGPGTYSLNHPSWVFDPTNTNLIGVLVIKANVTLSADGSSYTGKGTTDLYDFEGHSLFHSDFDVTGVRITPNDMPAFGGIPGLPLAILNR